MRPTCGLAGRVVVHVLVLVLVLGAMGRPALAENSPPEAGRGSDPTGGVVAMPGATPAPAPLFPVILVHGLSSNPVHAWGYPAPGKPAAGLYRFLQENGYQPGVTLFVCDYQADNNGDYTEISRRFLVPVIDRARAASGRDQVDIVAHSMGGLVARYYINSAQYRGDVRTLVMIGTPNRGSFGANVLKLWKVLRDQYQPGPFPPGETGDTEQGFRDERSFIGARARAVYAPLYREYCLEEDFIRAARRGRPPVTRGFEEWVAGERPALYRERFNNAQVPPLAPGYEREGLAKPPARGEDLAVSYYEALAMQAGRGLALRAAAPGAPLVKIDTGELTPGQGVWKAALQYLKSALVSLLAARARGAVESAALDLALSRVKDVLQVDPAAVAVDRLLEEKYDYPRGREPDGGMAYARLKGNYFLDWWNRREDGQRAARENGPRDGKPNVRYAVVAGRMLNLWAPVYDSVQENDIIVEVDSTYLPLRRDDVFKLYSGTVSRNHLSIKRSPAIHRFILETLRHYYPVSRRHAPLALKRWWRFGGWVEEGKGQASFWSPTYIEVDNSRLKGQSGELVLELSAPPPSDRRLEYRAWVLRDPPDGPAFHHQTLSLARKGRNLRGRIIIGDFGRDCSRVLLGIRLAGAGLGPETGKDFWSLPELPFSYRLSFRPVDEGKGDQGDGAGGSPGGTDSDAVRDQGASDRGADPEELASTGLTPPAPHSGPRIEVKVSRQTTSLVEDRTHHARWAWDFGDGAGHVDNDPAHTTSTVSHRFTSPGTYRVTAVSYSNKEGILRDGSWEVVIPAPAPGEEFAPREAGFSLETIREPRVDIDIRGPVEWITGRAAAFRVDVSTDNPPFCTRQKVSVDPGREFSVVWDRPGTYVVRVAVTVRLTYTFPERTLLITNTYIRTRRVRVDAIAVTE